MLSVWKRLSSAAENALLCEGAWVLGGPADAGGIFRLSCSFTALKPCFHAASCVCAPTVCTRTPPLPYLQ